MKTNSTSRNKKTSPHLIPEGHLGKIPPQATDLEEAVLGALMLEKNALVEVVEILKPDSFYKEAHRHIYEAVLALFGKSEPVDLLTVISELRRMGTLDIAGGLSYITQLTTRVNSAANIEYHARIVAEMAIKRELIRLGDEIIREAYEATTDVFILLDTMEQSLFDISEMNIRKNYSDMRSIMSMAIKELEIKKNHKDGLTGVPSGFSGLDRLTSGWQKSDLVILAARPGMGKCLGKGTKVLLYDGTLRKVEDIRTGDLLMGADSTPRKVLSIGYGTEQMYWIRQNKGIDYRVNESHILSLKRSREEGKHQKGEILTISVKDFLEKSQKFQSNYKGYKVAVEFSEKALPLEPYQFGKNLLDAENQDIANEYLANSTENRLILLASLIDSAGRYNTISNRYEIGIKNEILAQKMKFLADSLGFRTVLKQKSDTNPSNFEIQISGNLNEIPVQVLEKKGKKWDREENFAWTNIDIEKDIIDEYYGFELDGDGLFLLEDMTVTHNTAFVLSALRNAAVDHGKAVAIFSLEMSSLQLVNRLISAEAEIESNKLKTGKLADYEWEQLVRKTAKITESPIFIDDTPALSILELRAKCRRLKAQNDIQLVIIDYLQLMSGENVKGGGNREQEIAHISRSLKQIAKELDIPVIALSQLSRAVETRGGDKKPQLSDLRESGSIEQDADMVLFLYRPEYYGITEDAEGRPVTGMGEVIIAKHRNGSLDSVWLQFIGKYTKFADVEGANGGGEYAYGAGGGFSGDIPSEFNAVPPQNGNITLGSKINNLPPVPPTEEPPF